MQIKTKWAYIIAGTGAGFVTGLLGAGGGMFLIPLLQLLVKPKEESLFPASVCIMLPICLISVCFNIICAEAIPWASAWPYLLGGTAGGLTAGLLDKKIPTLYLHKGLGLLIIWGGVRFLW